jgi:hypothetical protein
MSPHRRTPIRVFALLPAAGVLASACSGFGPRPGAAAAPSSPGKEVVAVAESARPVTRDQALERQVTDLELRLLEKGAQVAELQARLDDTRLEVVRAMAKLQSLATRAEAASGIAEAELAAQSLSPAAATEAVAEVRQLMAQASAEFDKANYAGALYLANQAKNAATTAGGQLASADQGSARPGERPLALALPLETTTAANVREGPGMRFGVVFTLPPRAPIVAYSSAEQWLRIADDSGRRGWISQNLIRGRP